MIGGDAISMNEEAVGAVIVDTGAAGVRCVDFSCVVSCGCCFRSGGC